MALPERATHARRGELWIGGKQGNQASHMVTHARGADVGEPTHILYGSDFPYTPVPIIARTKESLEREPLIADRVQDVFSHNAERLFGLM